MSIRNACPAFFKPAPAADHVNQASRSILATVLAYDRGLINCFQEQAFLHRGMVAAGAQVMPVMPSRARFSGAAAMSSGMAAKRGRGRTEDI
ncbi:hypothetical protein [Rhodovulum sp. MB263]|uniref:hypothetical protein n=1 Tax=Rhodovulum sp. (strain MB263) TaxID=308754 RepID=UPI0009B7C7D8|nr:hypothetical protein [Rhodovulum sp. MB263]ARC89834.1 hypothetical protein B5V46_15090 [Rhodovulum sp. MB263]